MNAKIAAVIALPIIGLTVVGGIIATQNTPDTAPVAAASRPTEASPATPTPTAGTKTAAATTATQTVARTNDTVSGPAVNKATGSLGATRVTAGIAQVSLFANLAQGDCARLADPTNNSKVAQENLFTPALIKQIAKDETADSIFQNYPTLTFAPANCSVQSPTAWTLAKYTATAANGAEMIVDGTATTTLTDTLGRSFTLTRTYSVAVKATGSDMRVSEFDISAARTAAVKG